MNPQFIIDQTVEFVKKQMSSIESGHNWYHIERVWKLSKIIAENEDANIFIVQLGALLHDIADSKFHDGDELIGPRKARIFLEKLSIEESIIQHIENIISNISYRNSFSINKKNKIFASKELEIIQDADRLDAIGAIGIARAFNYGGFRNRELYDPNIKVKTKQTKAEYKNSSAPTINHFYEKLLLIKDKMNTKTGRQLAVERHRFMEQYLIQFQKEWNGEF